jgi:hypothetical protein
VKYIALLFINSQFENVLFLQKNCISPHLEVELLKNNFLAPLPTPFSTLISLFYRRNVRQIHDPIGHKREKTLP